MLINFSIKNWMSFHKETALSMIASRELQHSDRVFRFEKYGIKILPAAAIYGGNASGKSNFFKALHFAQNLIVKGNPIDSSIAVEPFLLSKNAGEQPTRFTFDLLIENNIYHFSFSVTNTSVIEEKLILIKKTTEEILYDRNNDSQNFDDNSLLYAFKGTRDNQLFLTNSVSQKIDTFKPIYNWFKNNLVLVSPDSKFSLTEQFFDEDHPLFSSMNQMLPLLNTGILHMGGEEIPLDSLPIPDVVKRELKEGMSFRIKTEPKERFVLSKKNGELIVKKLVTFHARKDGSKVKFDIRQESDGSIRIIDLLPAFLDLRQSNKTYVIDELDRSLHTLLTRNLIEFFLNFCTQETRKQLLFTTHDAQLIDQKLFRRDEIWATEKDSTGNSTLFSFSEFKDVRSDKDIRKSYLQGRLGGVPEILL